ncbi:MAG: hypothetical protein LVS60_07270 [Nodosilinea sp. LVE1205-7]|jgi:Sec-independent protein translocase protein TatA
MVIDLAKIFRNHKLSSPAWGTLLACMVVISLASCGSSKVVQCNNLATVVNQTQGFMKDFETEIQTFSQNAGQVKNLSDIKAAASQYTTAVDKVVTNLDKLTADLEGTSLNDARLKEFRVNYVEVVKGFKSSLQEARQAMDLVVTVQSEAELPAKIEESQQQTVKAVKSIENLSQQEAKLISEVNTYCGASQPEATPKNPNPPTPAPQ